MKNDRKHYYLIDGIRGFAILNMVLFHFLYDVNIVYGKCPHWYTYPTVHIWQQFICFSFIFISGISFHFSHRNLKRGLLLNFYGIAITVITLLFLPSETIWFGILNFIGCAILLLCLLEKLLKKFPPIPGLLSAILLFILTYHIEDGYIGFSTYPFIAIPKFFYQIPIFTIFGFPFPQFVSSDFFPIFPWFFLFLTGYWFWLLLTGKERILSLAEYKIPFLSSLGSISIWVYLLHQPLSILICEILF